jgi:hypothetical protein
LRMRVVASRGAERPLASHAPFGALREFAPVLYAPTI